MGNTKNSSNSSKLKNYTSTVSVSSSLETIERLLVEAGAKYIGRFYDEVGGERRIGGFMFQMEVDGIPMTFKLPSNPNAVRRIMESDVKRPRKGTMNKVWQQAERTAWKILADWVHLQVTMIKMQQAEVAQIFLPYVYDHQSDSTLFDRLKANKFKQLTGKSKE